MYLVVAIYFVVAMYFVVERLTETILITDELDALVAPSLLTAV